MPRSVAAAAGGGDAPGLHFFSTIAAARRVRLARRRQRGVALEEIIEGLVREGIAGAEVRVSGAGNRFHVRVRSPAFAGLSRVRRQQLVYAAIDGLIRDGSVHAVTIETEAPGRA